MNILKLRFSLSALLLLFALTNPVYASEETEKEKLVQTYIEVSGLKNNLIILTQDLLKLELKKRLSSNPKVTPELFNEIFLIVSQTFEERTDAIIGPLGKLYAETFTADELRAIIVFQKSPVGQKAARLMPLLTQKGMVLGAKWGKEVGALTVQRIQELFKKKKIDI